MLGTVEGSIFYLNWVRLGMILLSSTSQVFGNIFRRKRSLENHLRNVQEMLERVDAISLAQLERSL